MGVEQQKSLRKGFHDVLGLAAQDALSPAEQLVIEKNRPDFTAAVDAARSRLAHTALTCIQAP